MTDSIENLKYKRFGYINFQHPSDQLLKVAVDNIPCDHVLPERWYWLSLDKFNAKHGIHGSHVWAKTTSYHMYMFMGHHVFRFWTDQKAFTGVDVNDAVANMLSSMGVDLWEIPESCARKCRPMTKRIKVSTEEDVLNLVRAVHQVYRFTGG